ncbi:hypothetical protein B0H34DRAFT_802474 [Crassisporium funariophilum]|nr:hypothetical protein B0H34DRAFT_802474 [Crassisporium funariophilum]
MRKGSTTPSFDVTMKDLVRRARSGSSADQASSIHSSATSPRMSILPSVKLSSLRRQQSGDLPTHQKSPLLTLKLSSPLFLDSAVRGELSSDILYQIKTVGTTTTVARTDLREDFVRTASIKWPRIVPTRTKGKEHTDGVLIQMRGAPWNSGETVLQPGSNDNSARRFNIPNYSKPMKWKRYGNSYWCTTPSVKGPVATLDLVRGSEPTKLTVYETLHDKYDPNVMSAFQGVSVLLLDYLLVTALLMVTDIQDWMLVRKAEGTNLSIPYITALSGQGPSSVSDLPSTSDPQWRKIMYGEPIYPKLSGELRNRTSETSLSMSPTTPGLPRTPTSAGTGMPTFPYVESDSSSSRPSSRKMTIASTLDDSDSDELSVEESRPPSPSAESMHYPAGSAPTHLYIDPSFYPPVPPIPSQYAKSMNGRNFSSQPSTPISPGFKAFRELPQPPKQHNIPRPRSSPPLEGSHSVYEAYPYSPDAPSSSGSMRTSISSLSRSASAARRPLPHPPPVPTINSANPMVRRAQSSNQLMINPSLSKGTPPRPQRSLPPTPNHAHITAVEEEDPEDEGHLRVSQHSRQPPITKVSQEDLTQWVHTLTSPQRDLPPAPIPRTSIFDVPPPAYDTIHFSSVSSRRRPPVPVTRATIDTSP